MRATLQLFGSVAWGGDALACWHYCGSHCRLEPSLASKTCSRGGMRTWVVSLFSVLRHTIYRTQSGLFKPRVGMSIGAATATGAQGKLQEFLAGRVVFFLHLSELTGACTQLRRNAGLGMCCTVLVCLRSCYQGLRDLRISRFECLSLTIRHTISGSQRPLYSAQW